MIFINKKANFIIENFWELLFSIPKTIYFNFKLLDFWSAVRLPYIVSHNIKLTGINRKSLIIEKHDLPFASQRVGFSGSGVGRRESKKGLISIRNNGKIIIKGYVGMGKGVIIDNDGGIISFGNRFRCNYSATISCDHAKIYIGDGVVCGWNVTIKNGDGHYVLEKNIRKPSFAYIIIGDHVWLCSHSTILKNVNIGNDCVVAYGSLVTKAEGVSNQLYAGVPAKVLRDEINWNE